MSLVIVGNKYHIHTNAYRNHRVFSQLSNYTDFYGSLSFAVMGWVQSGIEGGGVFAMSYVYSSIQGTLESIKTVLRKGRINDAYALLRKYHDSIIINVYADLYLKENFSINNLIVERINKWVKGDQKLPRYKVMSKYIAASTRLKPITDLLTKDDTYTQIRNHCNDHTHYNFFQYLLLNDKVVNQDRIKPLNEFSADLENLFIMHLAYIFYLNQHYMASSDYEDALDIGQTPDEGLQYQVAPYVQEVFDKVIKVKRPDIAIALAIKHGTMMQLD